MWIEISSKEAEVPRVSDKVILEIAEKMRMARDVSLIGGVYQFNGNDWVVSTTGAFDGSTELRMVTVSCYDDDIVRRLLRVIADEIEEDTLEVKRPYIFATFKKSDDK